MTMSGGRYLKMNKIGEGTYGKVYKALNLKTSEVVALKSINTLKEAEGVPGTALREITLLRELDHPNVIKIRDVRLDPTELVIILEYLPLDLGKFLQNNQLSISDIKVYMYQLCHAVSYCHGRRIIHRDLKPDNILMTKDGRIKIADFGLARAFCGMNRTFSSEVVTLWYRAPELLLGITKYSYQVDIWSLGCICVEMLRGKPLFKASTEISQLKEIFRIMSTPDEKLWPEINPNMDQLFEFKSQGVNKLPLILKDYGEKISGLVLEMLIYDPSLRSSARALMANPFFEKPEPAPRMFAKGSNLGRSRCPDQSMSESHSMI